MTDKDRTKERPHVLTLYPILNRLRNEVIRRGYNPFAALREPRSTEVEDIRQWIKDVGSQTGTTPTELAVTADLAPSTINKFMQDVEGPRNLNARTLNKIKKAAEVFLSRITADDEHYIEVEFGVDKDGALPGIHSNPYYIRELKIIGNIYDQQICHYNDIQMDEIYMYDISVPVSRKFIDRPLCGLQLNVSVSENYYQYQDIIVCRPLLEEDEKLSDGDRVIVLEPDNHHDNCRLSIRDLLIDPKGHSWLVSPYEQHEGRPGIYVGKSERRALPPGTSLLFLVVASYHQR